LQKTEYFISCYWFYFPHLSAIFQPEMLSLAFLIAFVATNALCAPLMDLAQPGSVGKCSNKYFFLHIPGTHECVLRHLNAVPESILVASNKEYQMFYNWNTYNYELWLRGFEYFDMQGNFFRINTKRIRQFTATILGFGMDMTIVNLNLDNVPSEVKDILDTRLKSGSYVMMRHTNAVEFVPVSHFNLRHAYFCTDKPLEQMESFMIDTQPLDEALKEVSGRTSGNILP
jgi:hypothetical protein